MVMMPACPEKAGRAEHGNAGGQQEAAPGTDNEDLDQQQGDRDGADEARAALHAAFRKTEERPQIKRFDTTNRQTTSIRIPIDAATKVCALKCS